MFVVDTMRVLFQVAHLTVAAIWLGSMAYSLTSVQPKIARHITDQSRREELLIVLAHGNRRPVLALITTLVLTAAGAILTGSPTVAIGYAVALGCYLPATAIFVNVSWRHWPTRVLALPEELPRLRRNLARQAYAMTALVATAYLAALTASVL